MTTNTTTLPDRAAAHAIERARLRDLREAIADRIARDASTLALLERRSPQRRAAFTPVQGDAQ